MDSELYRVGLVQFQPLKSPTKEIPDNVLHNVARMKEFVRATKEKDDVNLLVFPELGVCGYDVSDEVLRKTVAASEEILEEMKDAARTYKVRIVVSYPEAQAEEGKKMYIAASMISPEGTVELTYRKTHPWAYSVFETRNFELGDSFCASVPLHTPADEERECWLNVLICWDIEFPEPARVVRLQTPGRHHHSPLILCVPTANADKFIQDVVVRTRANENHAFVVSCNNAGEEFCGGSCVVGPDGEVLAGVEGTAEGVVVVEVDLGVERYREKTTMNPMLERRRPELYGVIGEEENWSKKD